jgi:hypothetical protein
MAAELAEVKCMWEMAATLDFLNLFRSVARSVWGLVGGWEDAHWCLCWHHTT